MPNLKPIRLGDLQLRIMKILWDQGECSVALVLKSLSAKPKLAYTTVATMLRKMEARGLVSHRTAGRSFIYQARLPAQAVTQSMTRNLVDKLFAGSLTDAVEHLLTTREVSREELSHLERLIEQRKKSL